MERRVFGPPGTGKTTFLTKEIKRAASQFGADAVFVSSYTRAAAAELVGRELPVDPDNVGTFHSLCYRLLGQPEIADTPEGILAWNDAHPNRVMSRKSVDQDGTDAAIPNSDMDAAFHEYKTNRLKMIPRDQWSSKATEFAKEWEPWKKANGTMDFSDLIETVYHDFDHYPGHIKVGFIDEAQDLCPLMLALARKWGNQWDYFYVSGDPDQTIYTFQGATPEAFLNPPLPPEQKVVLRQSHRIPGDVHRYAEWWIGNVKVREPREYLPRSEPGKIRMFNQDKTGMKYTAPELIVKDATQYMDQGKRVMVLGRAGYMLDPLVRFCRAEGIPFHNPYARDRYDWNPLTPSRGVSSAERLQAYLKPCWTPEDVEKWTHLIKKKNASLKPHLKDIVKAAKQMTPDRPFYPDDVTDDPDLAATWVWGTQEEKLEWLRNNLAVKARGGVELNLACAKKGHEIGKTPLLIPGTFHSVKGGEAEVVYLLPDMTPATKREWDSGDKDTEWRTWYVGITRARETLVLCGSASRDSVPWKVPKD